MSTPAEMIAAHFEARDWIVEQVGGPVPGEDLIKVLAAAIVGDINEADTEMSLTDVQELVLTVVRQRREDTPT